MSIITKTGDKGQTSLYSLERVAKAHPRIEAVGCIDELSANLGGLGLEWVQEALFELGAGVANTQKKASDEVLVKELERLESAALDLEGALPPLQNFILPGGCEAAVRVHIARTVCRRAERRLSEVDELPKGALPFLNRLSDYLFLLARKLNWEAGYQDSLWKQSQS